ncbi:hypothetical protein BU14_0556s0001 [Porphyra umbilicalis]|uniref:VCBS repeat-containing protein n=1 Tax=Porphyra umbilicalis TaxID=2786 RepID=A0A1X6NRW0_PORUM|nr:hypothetical protein BU14_0556s0001 [Porphyra umbilicalis]|eukprot:OSX71315.1 hypothetical protein BU14_0556s0001 [Porphyra umbilicalis]
MVACRGGGRHSDGSGRGKGGGGGGGGGGGAQSRRLRRVWPPLAAAVVAAALVAAAVPAAVTARVGATVWPTATSTLHWAAVCRAVDPPVPVTRTIPERGGGRCPPPAAFGTAHVRLGVAPPARGDGGGSDGGGGVTTYATSTATAAGGDVYITRVAADGRVLSATPLRARLAGTYGGAVRRVAAVGPAVTAVGDVDGDGTTDVAVSAVVAVADGRWVSGIFVVCLTPGGDVQTANVLLLAPGFGCPAGSSLPCTHTVAGVGDVDGDGVPDVAVASNWRSVALVTLSRVAAGNLKAVSALRRSWYLDDGRVKEAPPPATIVGVGDVDGDGVPDVVLNDPWYRRGRGALIMLHLTADGGVASEHRLSGHGRGEGGLPAGFGGGPGAWWGAVLAFGGVAADGQPLLVAGNLERVGVDFLVLHRGRRGRVDRTLAATLPLPVVAVSGVSVGAPAKGGGRGARGGGRGVSRGVAGAPR